MPSAGALAPMPNTARVITADEGLAARGAGLSAAARPRKGAGIEWKRVVAPALRTAGAPATLVLQLTASMLA